jgi:hypothetical protein
MIGTSNSPHWVENTSPVMPSGNSNRNSQA